MKNVTIVDNSYTDCQTLYLFYVNMLQAYNCDDLYSLDSDYFLSSLEDISVQI